MGRKGYSNKKESAAGPNSKQNGLHLKPRHMKKKPKHQPDPANTNAILKSLKKESNPDKKPSRNQILRAKKRVLKSQQILDKKSQLKKASSKEKVSFTEGKDSEGEEEEEDMEFSGSQASDDDVHDDAFKQNFPYAHEEEDNVLEEDDFLPKDDNFDMLAGDSDEDAEDDEDASDAELMEKNGGGAADFDGLDVDDDEDEGQHLERLKARNQMIALPSGEFIRPPMMPGSGLQEDAALNMDERIRTLLQLISPAGKESKARKSGKVSRQALRSELLDLLCSRYSYCSFLMYKFMDLFPNDLMEFIEANETDRPLTIRVNTLKTRRKDLMQALTSRGMNLSLEGLDWTRVGVVVDATSVPPGATPEYLAGHYALQGVSSFLPVMALDPRPDEKVLDLCAAPGMKTTFIGQAMKNSGILVANDSQEERCKAIVGNLHRMGISNAVVCHFDGCEFSRHMANFDRVLVDAPCSGTGIIAKDPSVKTSRCDARDIQRTVDLQKRLLKEAIACCNVGGVVVYSTCSILIEENEHVANYVLKKGLVEVMDLPSTIPGDEGIVNFKGLHFDKDLKKARRVYPHRHNMDGFFLVKFKKLK